MQTTHVSLSPLSLSLAITLLLQGVTADTTMAAVSEYSDGQPQAPTGSASSWSPTTEVAWSGTSSYDNPFTVYTSMTNSLGVITGMPSVVTSQPSQPALVTSQPPSATLPYYSGYYYNTSTTAPTTLTTSTVLASASNNDGVFTTASSSGSAIATFAQVTGAAVSNKMAGAGVGLAIAALGFSLL